MKCEVLKLQRRSLMSSTGVAFLAFLLCLPQLSAAAAATPKISATPASVTFSPVKVGGTALKTVTIKNTGAADLVVNAGNITISGADHDQFSQTNSCADPLPQNGTCAVSVTFAPAKPFGKKRATLNIPSNASGKPKLAVKLSGQAPPPIIVVSPMAALLTAPALNQPSSAAAVTIKNNGVSDLTITSITATGTNAAQFSVLGNTCDSPLQSGESCTANVVYTPVSPAMVKGTLAISSDAPKKSTVNVKLNGKISAFSMADLAGSWSGSMLNTEANAGLWMRMALDITSGGKFSTKSMDSNGETSTSDNGSLSITPDGKVAVNGTNIVCNTDSGKTILSCTDNSKRDAVVHTTLSVFTKKTGSYSLSDLEGAWRGNYVSGVTGTHSWKRASVTINGSGVITAGQYTDSNGNTGAISGAFTISPNDGTGTEVFSLSNLKCSLDTGKTVLACTDTTDTGGVGIAVFTKSGAAYGLADLAGAWYLHSIAIGPDAPCWLRIAVTIKADGSYTSKEVYYDGSSDKQEKGANKGRAQITANGISFSSNKEGLLCQLDANRTAMACTETWSDGSTSIVVATKGFK